MENSNLKIPILFQKIKKYESIDDDIRFIRVKIWLMHLGENLNGSYFSKEVVEAAIPTLANTPILAYIEENRGGELDFSDHREILVKKDGNKYETKYIGQAIGLIPLDNNAQFENRLCDDGIERTFLTVEGLIWTKFDEPVDILDRDMIKSQSMELAEDYEGEFQEDKLFHFTKFSFFGACGLGMGVLPAMRNSTIEVQFSYDNFSKELNSKIEVFKRIYNSTLSPSPEVDHNKVSQEGGNNVLEQVVEMLQKYSLSVDDLTAKSINYEEFASVDELEEKVKEAFAQSKTEFSLTSEQLEDELRRELAEIEIITEDWWGEVYQYPRYSYVDNKLDINIVVAWDCKNRYLCGLNFIQTNDNVEVDVASMVRYKIDYNPMNLVGDTDPEDDDGDITPDMVPYEMVDYQMKRKEAEVKSEFSAKLTEQQESILAMSKKIEEFTSIQEQKDAVIAELQQFKKQKQDDEIQSKVDALMKEYSLYLSIEEVEELKSRQVEFSSFESFEKEVKAQACDRITAQFKKDGKQFTAFVEKPKETEVEESNDVFTKLKNKFTQTKGE